jgi:hypothetical protein
VRSIERESREPRAQTDSFEPSPPLIIENTP